MAPVNKGLNDSEKKLVDFINAGKTAEAQLMVGDPDVDVNCLDENGMTPLQHASYKGNQQMVDYLICHGADVNSNDHDSGYTALMFAALSGNLGCVRSLLEAGAKTYPTNSVGRNAAQMAGFVGQHQVVSLINNFFSKEDLDYYTIPQGLEKEPKLPPELSPSLYKLILSNNLNPVKIVHYLQENPRLLEGENGKRIERVLDRLVEKMMRSHDTNEVMAMKFHYLLSIIKRCADNLKQSPQDNLNTLIRNLLRTNERGAHANQDHFVRSVLRTFPYAESQLLQQMVVQLAKTPVGGDPSSLSILNSGINGNRFASDDDNQCTTCAEFKAEKKCGACKMVRYCNQWCQKAHWFIHKKECKLLAEEFKRRQEEIKAQEEKDRKKKEEEEEKEKVDASKEETNGQTDESHNTSGDTDTLSQKLEKTHVQGEHEGQIEGTNKEGEKSRDKGQESRAEYRSPTDDVAAAGSDVKKASWGKNKGRRGRKGKKTAANSTAGVVPGCEKNRAECIAEEKNRPESRTGEKNRAENVEVDDIQVELGGENVHIFDDLTDLKAQGDGEKVGTTKGMTETEGERATGGKKCPFSGVTSGCGGLIPDRVMAQDSVDSTDSFDEKVEKGQVLPPGHPPVDIASLTPVGANTAPKNPMLDLRMFCPKFASEEGGNTGDRKDIYDDLGEPIDMDDFVKGFQEFLNKKKALEKKIRRVDDDSDEESD